MPIVLTPTTATVAYSAYVPDMSVYAPGCPALTLVDALRKTAAAFFYDSLAYRTWVTPFDLVADTTTYDIAAMCPSDTEVAQVMALYCQGIEVKERLHEEFLALDPEWPSLTGTNAEYFTCLDNKSSIDIIPSPEATITSAMTMQLAVTPTLTSTVINQTLMDEWKDQIVDGALARVLSIPGRTWTDLKAADARHSRYSSGKLKAKIQAGKGNTRRDTTVQMRRWV